jgi:signal transduction histidine kinase
MTVPAVGYPGLMAASPLSTTATRHDQVHQIRRAPRDWVVDALLFLLAIGFTVITFVDGIDRHLAPVPLAVDLVLGGLSCLGLWLRRRWPVGLAVIVGLFSIYSTSASGVALIALFTVAMYRPLAVVGPIAAGCALASLLTPLVRPDLSMPSWPQTLLGIVCVAAALAWGMYVRARRQLVLSLRERARRAESEQELRVAQARQLERNQIAREMHDVLAHRISLVSLHAGALELRPDARPDEIARSAGVIRDSAHRALEDLREVIGVLRAGPAGDDPADDAPERPQPMLADVPMLVDESRHAGMRVRLECEIADLAAVPAAVGRTVYRIVQEGLTNARKHAHEARVSVTLRGRAGDGLTVEIRNPWPEGADIAAIPGAGTGIIGLAERASLAGGRLEHGQTPAGDFRLWAWLPWPA